MLIHTILHFEGRDLQFEVPVNVSDEKIVDIVMRELAEASGGAAGHDKPSFLLFGVSAGHGAGNSTLSGHSPLSSAEVREAIQRDGMLLGVRQSKDAGALLKGGGMKLTVDVTPSCSILVNGGVDYDLPTALAELVDNAIAALEPITENATGSGTHSISIDMLPSSWGLDGQAEGPVLRVCDTGRGMGLPELRAWATLGEISEQRLPTAPVSEDNPDRLEPNRGVESSSKSNISTSNSSTSTSSTSGKTRQTVGGDKWLLGNLGRYGVGGKHAAFQLASCITVSTRPVGALFVYEATLDATVLAGDKSAAAARGWETESKGGGGFSSAAATAAAAATSASFRGGSGSGYSGKKGACATNGSGLSKGKQHRWVAELRVRAPTAEEVERTERHSSWTCLELKRLKPGFVLLNAYATASSSSSSSSSCNAGSTATSVATSVARSGCGVSNGGSRKGTGWAGADLLRRSLSNLFFFYSFPDPLPLFKTEGSTTCAGTGAPLSASLCPHQRKAPHSSLLLRPLREDEVDDEDDDRSGDNAPRGPLGIHDQHAEEATAATTTVAGTGAEQGGSRALGHFLPRTGLVRLSVGGVPLEPLSSDFYRYWAAARTEFRHELRVTPSTSSSNGSSNGSSVRVGTAFATIYLLYFPYVGGKETVPGTEASPFEANEERGTRDDGTGVKSVGSRGGGKGRGGGGRGSKAGKNWSSSSHLTDEVGLSSGGALSDSLVHVFWMGRLLPRGLGGRDERLRWMKPRKDQAASIPDRAWRRVRAFLFLGPQFEADRTKQALVPGAAYTRALLQQTDRRLQDRFCAWVGAAHKQFDEELWFDEPITIHDDQQQDSSVSLSQQQEDCIGETGGAGDRKIIEYRALFVGGTRYMVGDRVEVRPMRGGGAARAEVALAAEKTGFALAGSGNENGTDGKVMGTLQALYQIVDSYSREKFPMIDVVPQTATNFAAAQSAVAALAAEAVGTGGDGSTSSTGCGGVDSGRQTEAAVAEKNADSFLASSLVRKVDSTEWQRRGKLLVNSKPARLEWVECRLPGPLKGRHPPLNPITAGSEVMPFRIAIAVCSAEGKSLPKQTAGLTVSMVAMHKESGLEWSAKVSAENSSEVARIGQYCFSLLPPTSSASSDSTHPPSSSSSSLLAPTSSSPLPSSAVLGAGHFAMMGTYTYRWRCVELPLPTKEFSVEVLPAAPAALQLNCSQANQEVWLRQARSRARVTRRLLRPLGHVPIRPQQGRHLQPNSSEQDPESDRGGDSSDDDDDDGGNDGKSKQAVVMGSEECPVPARIGVPLDPLVIGIEDLFANSVAWRRIESKGSAISSGANESRSPTNISTSALEGKKHCEASSTTDVVPAAVSITKLAQAAEESAFPLIRVTVEVVEPSGGRLTATHRWLTDDEDAGRDGRNLVTNTLTRRLEVTVTGMINTTAPKDATGNAVSGGGGENQKDRARQPSSLSPFEERVQLRIRAHKVQPSRQAQEDSNRQQAVTLLPLEDVEFWVNVSAGKTQHLAFLPSAAVSEPPTSLPNLSPLPPLRLVLLDGCGNRVAFPPHVQETPRVLLRCEGAEKAMKLVLRLRTTSSSHDQAATSDLDNKVATTSTTAFGWSDIGAYFLPQNWATLNVSSRLNMNPKQQLHSPPSVGRKKAATSSSHSSSLTTARIEAFFDMDSRAAGSSASDNNEPSELLPLLPTVLWHHEIAVLASSAPFALGLGRPYLRLDSVPATHEGAQPSSSSDPSISWLPPIANDEGASWIAETTNEIESAAYHARPVANLGGAGVPILAGRAGATVQGLVVRVLDESGEPWQVPDGGWRLALCRGRQETGEDASHHPQKFECLSVVPLSRKQTVAAVALPEFTLSTEVGNFKLCVRLLRPSLSHPTAETSYSVRYGGGVNNNNDDDDGDDSEELDKVAVEINTVVEVYPSMPYKLRLQKLDLDPKQASASETAAALTAAARKKKKGSALVTPATSCLTCGDCLVLAVHVEDQFTNPIMRSQWDQIGAAWDEKEIGSTATNLIGDRRIGESSIEQQKYQQRRQEHKQQLLCEGTFIDEEMCQCWRLPMVLGTSKAVNLATLDPVLFIKEIDEGGQEGGGEKRRELVPRLVVETAFGWDMEGVCLGGKSGGLTHKVIIRDMAGALKASNIHVAFESGPADRVELNGQVVWKHPSSHWRPGSCDDDNTENGEEEKIANMEAPSPLAFSVHNGGRLPTIVVKVFDEYSNPIFPQANRSNRAKGHKEGGEVAVEKESSVLIRVKPKLEKSKPSGESNCSRHPQRKRQQESSIEEELIQLIPKETDSTHSEVSKNGSTAAGTSSGFGAVVVAKFSQRSGAATVRDVILARHRPKQQLLVGNMAQGGNVAEHVLCVVVSGLSVAPFTSDDNGQNASSNEPSSENHSQAQHGRIFFQSPAGLGANSDGGVAGGSGVRTARLECSFPLSVLPGRFPDRVELAVGESTYSSSSGSCSKENSLGRSNTDENSQAEDLHSRKTASTEVAPGGNTVLCVTAGQSLPPLRLLVRGEDGEDVTKTRRPCEFRIDVFSSSTLSSSSSPAKNQRQQQQKHHQSGEGGFGGSSTVSAAPLRTIRASLDLQPSSSSSQSSAAEVGGSSSTRSNIGTSSSIIIRDQGTFLASGTYTAKVYFTAREGKRDGRENRQHVDGGTINSTGTAEGASSTAYSCSLLGVPLLGLMRLRAGDVPVLTISIRVLHGPPTSLAILSRQPHLVPSSSSSSSSSSSLSTSSSPSSLGLCEGGVESSIVVSRNAVLAAPLRLKVLDSFGNLCSSLSTREGTAIEAHHVILTMLSVDAPTQAEPSVVLISGPKGVVGSSTRGPYLYPDGSVALKASLQQGVASFTRVELLSHHQRNSVDDATDGPAAGEAQQQWMPGRYCLRAELRGASMPTTPLSSASSSSSLLTASHEEVVAFSTDIDVFPEASEIEAGVLQQRKELLTLRKALVTEAEALREDHALVEKGYRERRDQLKRFDAELAEIRSEVENSFVRLARVRHVTGERGSCYNAVVGAAELSQVDRCAAISERVSELKASHKRRRATRLGHGSRVDNDLRRIVKGLGELLVKELRRRKRSRADSSAELAGTEVGSIRNRDGDGGEEPSVGRDEGAVLDKTDAEELEGVESSGVGLVLGLVGESAFLPPQDNKLSAALAGHVGIARMRAVVLRRRQDIDMARATLLEHNSAHSLGFVALDDLPREREQRPSGGIANQGENEGHVDLVVSGAYEGEAAVAIEAELDGEPLIPLSLHTLGLSEQDLRDSFNWCGFAVNLLRFPPKDLRHRQRPKPSTFSSFPTSSLLSSQITTQLTGSTQASVGEEVSFRRDLWLPILGKTVVLETLQDARNFRDKLASLRAQGTYALVCRDGHRIDEYGFEYGPEATEPTQSTADIPSAAALDSMQETNGGAGGGSSSRSMWFGELPLVFDRELHALESLSKTLAFFKGQLALRNDFHVNYYTKAKQLLKTQKQQQQKGASCSNYEGARSAIKLHKEITALDSEIKLLRPPVTPMAPSNQMNTINKEPNCQQLQVHQSKPFADHQNTCQTPHGPTLSGEKAASLLTRSEHQGEQHNNFRTPPPQRMKASLHLLSGSIHSNKTSVSGSYHSQQVRGSQKRPRKKFVSPIRTQSQQSLSQVSETPVTSKRLRD